VKNARAGGTGQVIIQERRPWQSIPHPIDKLMIKRFLERFRRDRGLHKATIRIDFFPENLVNPHIFWFRSQDHEADTVPLILFFYARILYELAETNKVLVAKQLIDFLEQVCQKLLVKEGPPRRLQLPLGGLKLTHESQAPAVRTYQSEFYQLQGGGYRLEFRGSLGKEERFLPGAFLALLQSCIENLQDETLARLFRRLSRLHDYYRLRRDFWDSGALIAGPVFALGSEEVREDLVED
jgi:hypothetical protein